MNLTKLVHSETGKYILSIILGLGLATLFRATCKGTNCVAYHAPPMEEIDNKIYKYNNKCYKFVQSPVKCNSKKQTIEFA